MIEGQQIQVERMDRNDVRLEGIEDKFLELDVKVLALDLNVQSLDSKVEALDSKVDALDVKVDALDVKVGAVASDLKLHRRDTEAHHGVYRVKESKE